MTLCASSSSRHLIKNPKGSLQKNLIIYIVLNYFEFQGSYFGLIHSWRSLKILQKIKDISIPL
jgi:hypothetical protein